MRSSFQMSVSPPGVLKQFQAISLLWRNYNIRLSVVNQLPPAKRSPIKWGWQ